jgi:hypothetical protein
VATNPEKPVAAFAGFGSRVVICDYNRNNSSELTTGLGDYIRQLRFLPGGRLAAIGQHGLEVWNLDTATLESRQHHNPGEEYFAVRETNSELLIACSGCCKPLTVV